MKRNFILRLRSQDDMKFTIASKSGQQKTKKLLFRINLFFILLCSLYPLQSAAQQVRIYNIENSGLPHNQVKSIAIDAHGNKWFGTFYGEVIKFDNENWTVYDNTNSGLPGEYRISSIAIDAQDNKWFGASFNPTLDQGGGLVKFDNLNWTVYNTSNSGLPNNTVTGIAIDSLGNKWIGTWSGLAKFDSKWTSYLSSKPIVAINIDNYGNKWIATQSEIAKFDDTNWTTYKYSKSIIPYYNGNGGITSIAFDKKGNKWFGVGEDWDSGAAGGVTEFDDVNWTNYNSNNSGLYYSVDCIAIDKEGNKWFGASTWIESALIKFDGTNWTVYDSNTLGYTFDWMNSIAIDDLGNKWITTGNYGVIVFNENGLTVGLDDKLSDSSDDFAVYPNPAKNFISINAMQSGILEIFNFAGEIIKTSEVQAAPTKINISNFPNGIYTIRVTSSNKTVAKKFIKN
ncbi:T9SS type A sorting domain-containing protein [Mariniphaga sp.]|uniref:Periplasmic ligand-binding sensor domain-containing protein n=1 Tax=Mariniphaga sp. TaxID=1954475 RepID=UPI0035659B26